MMCIHVCCVIASADKGLLYLFSCSAILLGCRITAIKALVWGRFPVCWLAFLSNSFSAQSPLWYLTWSEVGFRSVSLRVNNLTKALKEAGANFLFFFFLAACCPHLLLVDEPRNQGMKCSGRQSTGSWWPSKTGGNFSSSDLALAINELTGWGIEITRSKLLGTDYLKTFLMFSHAEMTKF